ncbi:MAG: hypothetical protein JOZ39_04450, partial [Chloroflexi bacterium]|nr:hypothetical protein [Chloroflexota bacterium]
PEMPRKRALNLYHAAHEAGPYDERPMLPEKFDLQLHLSRNVRPQPFFLICDHDTVLVQMSGEAAVEFRESSVRSHALEPGTFVYVPAGTPHRVMPQGDSVQVRYKAQEPTLEGVAWYCPQCGAEVWRTEWELATELPQEGYARACREFNEDRELRVCPGCGAEHPLLDLDGIRWEEIARDLRSEEPVPA